MIIEVLIAETFGVSRDDPKVIGVMRAIDPHYDRDKRIYQLRASGLSPVIIAERFGIHRRQVHRIIVEQLELRRVV